MVGWHHSRGVTMKDDILRRCVAECTGTFALVFIGCTTRAMIGDTTDFAGI
jgi:tetrahydromethanopterin S-methyltransferase subunit C